MIKKVVLCIYGWCRILSTLRVAVLVEQTITFGTGSNYSLSGSIILILDGL